MGKLELDIYITSGDETLLLQKIDHSEIMLTNNETFNIEIVLDQKKQVIDGFGAAMTESSAYLISQLEQNEQEDIIADLFTNQGIDISFIRTTIGASDFSLRSFTYNDLEKGSVDIDQSNFNLSDDLNYLIPILKKVKQHKQYLMMSSPWSAPAWMKDNQALNGGKLLESYYPSYAKYLVKFIKSYESYGLPVYAITPQNEPKHESLNYPSMLMDYKSQSKLITEVGKAFKENNIETKIMAYDHNWDDVDYAKGIYQDQDASKYVAGTAFHCYDGDVKNTAQLQNAFPDKDIWFTECSGGLWANDFSDNLGWNIEHVFIGSLKHGAKSVLLWNIALDEDCGPKNGGCMNCRGLITIHSKSKVVSKNVEYYLIGHFSKFVQPKAMVVKTDVLDPDLLSISFTNEDQSVVNVTYNKSDKQKTVQLKIKDEVITFVLKKKSLVTIKMN